MAKFIPYKGNSEMGVWPSPARQNNQWNGGVCKGSVRVSHRLLGAATTTHVQVGDPFFFSIIIGAVAGIALEIHQPEVFRLTFSRKTIESLEDNL